MKFSALIATFLLTALGAASAAAQVTSIRFSAPLNPIAGLPKILPSPLTGPLVGTGISLPTPLPSLTPSVILTPAHAASALPASIAPAALPARGGQIAAVPADSSRDGVVNPLRRVQPGVVFRFAGAQGPAASGSDASKGRLDETFDGEKDPSKPAVNLPRRAPVTSGRHVSLPEDDLMKELGF